MDLHLKEDSLKGGRGGGEAGMQFGFERQFLKVILKPGKYHQLHAGLICSEIEVGPFPL